MQCRICFEDATAPRNRLIDPCACTGSSQYIHELCLKYWIRIDPEKNSELCPVCQTPYRISVINIEFIPSMTSPSLFILYNPMMVGSFTHYGVLMLSSGNMPVVEAKAAQFFFQLVFHLSYAINNKVRNKEAYKDLLKRSYMPAIILSYLYLSYQIAVYNNVTDYFILNFVMHLIWREHIRILGLMNAEVQ
jgi:E3 ubiquitin-protein ligase DOA10